MRKLLLLFFCFLLVVQLSAQGEWFVGFETAVSNDVFLEVSDPDNVFDSNAYLSLIPGFTIRKEVARDWSLETGVLFKSYNKRYTFSASSPNLYSPNMGYSGVLQTCQFPIRLKKTFSLQNNRLSITPIIGLRICLKSEEYEIDSLTDMMNLNYTQLSDYELAPQSVYELLELGLSFDYKFKSGMLLSLFSNYQAGFTSLMKQHLTYARLGVTMYEVDIKSRGDYWSIGLGIQYPLSEVFGRRR